VKSRLYRGTVFHCRHTPRRHAFSYRVFMPLIDLEALPELMDGVPLWSARGPALVRFQRRDFLGDPDQPLTEEVRRRIREETGEVYRGPILLLANWRYLGFQTNPIACYFCYDTDGETLRHIVVEVTNTPWGERHSYVLAAASAGRLTSTEFSKAMHVSPFNPMAMTYRWHSTPPEDTLTVKLSNMAEGERVFDAVLTLESTPFTPTNLALTALLYPLMTLRVFLAIYWQALRLWLKGIPFFAHPKRT